MVQSRQLQTRPSITGAILAGGMSTRMGQPKAGALLWDDMPMIAHVIDLLKPVCQHIVLVGNCQGIDLNLYPEISRILDKTPGLGPISGIEALLESQLDQHYLVVTCDQPLLSSSLLKMLIDFMEPNRLNFFGSPPLGGGVTHLDPFPGIYPETFLGVVQESIANQQYSLRRLIADKSLNSPDPKWLPISETSAALLESINTPEQLSWINRKFQASVLGGVF